MRRRTIRITAAIVTVAVVFGIGMGIGVSVPTKPTVVTKVITVPVEIERIVTKEVPISVERIVTVPTEVEKVVTREVTRVVTVIYEKIVTPVPTSTPVPWYSQSTVDELTGTRIRIISQSQWQANGKYYLLNARCDRESDGSQVFIGGVDFVDENVAPEQITQSRDDALYKVQYRFDSSEVTQAQWPNVIPASDALVWHWGEEAKNFFYRVFAADKLIFRVTSWPDQASHTATFDLSNVDKQTLRAFLGACE